MREICTEGVFLPPLIEGEGEIHGDNRTTELLEVHIRLDELAWNIVDGWGADVVRADHVCKFGFGVTGEDRPLGNIKLCVFKNFRWHLMTALHKWINEGNHWDRVYSHQKLCGAL